MQSAKAPCSIVVTESGMKTSVNELQPANVFSKILATLFGIFNDFNDSQYWKTSFPILFTEFGMSICFNEVHE